MTGYNFTDRVRFTLQLSREEAMRLGHLEVSPDHILLGLAVEGGGVASAAAKNLGKELTALAPIVESRMKPKTGSPRGSELPYTSEAKKVLELSMLEARELGHTYVGTEHLLLAVAREGHSVAAQVLTEAGLTLDILRTEVLRLLGQDVPPRGPVSDSHPRIPRPTPDFVAYGPDVFPAQRVARTALLLSVIALLLATAALVVAAR